MLVSVRWITKANTATAPAKDSGYQRQNRDERHLHQVDEVSALRPARLQEQPDERRAEDPAELEGHEGHEGEVDGAEQHALHELGSQGTPMAGRQADESDWQPHQHRETEGQEQDDGQEPHRDGEAPQQVRQRAAWVEIFELPAAPGATSMVVLVNGSLPVLQLRHAGPAPVAAAALTCHMVAPTSLLGHDAACRTSLGTPHCPALVQPLLPRNLPPVLAAGPARVGVGVVVAEVGAALAAHHLGDRISLLVRAGLAEGAAARALPDRRILAHLPEPCKLLVRLGVRQLEDFVGCGLGAAEVASNPVHAAVHHKASDVVPHALAADAVVLGAALREHGPLLLPDVLKAERALESSW
mmetsp:Transcript_25552/g.73778  ORF Transcript_25552/g.73778 Transcript_25552/m.73778 type:complete len:356 (-) Transcript_25552:392-1459(-)